ncbi:serologically defined colon cancer antigen 8 isoform X1 [Phasianus colchicus]|uniref:Serologically defined colon cancer antigen 8 n=1 Tax=Phasianus colchicus TaxID=9054 RepID=A0A669P523_PHACC|nr:serologically defined colon cancer antigen 8 isoform X1 [Phasianus colchicus]XP_031448553.1 serologically defined colon cancer antigen 8 isoform X1 [Phasianus colchicus]XP_031448562.1 serologically defined colon cancer antigen 8 isoform X1 [Phasianus colchicus]
MRAPRGQPALEESLRRYQRRLRERANESIHQLKYALEERHFAESKDEAGFDQSSVDKGTDDVDGSNDNSGNPPWEELQHSHAVNQLKILLQHQEKMESEASPSRRKMQFQKTPEAVTEDLPDPSDLIPRINDQSQYINHLEAEVKFCKEELSEMKDQVRVVILENEDLHQKLKFLTAEYTLGEQALLDTSNSRHNDLKLHQPSISSSAYNRDPALVSKTVGEVEKWHVELEKLKLLYQDKTNILDAQVQSLRKHLSESQKTCEDLEARLKHQKSLVSATNSSRVGGLCLKCAQQEAILAQTHSNVHMQAIERVTKERDDLMDALVSVRRNMKEMQQRESNAYEQVKQAVQMTEEANLEKTKALVQCEQLKSEMERQKNRLEKELAVQLNKRTEEKEALREEMKKERENLAAMVTASSENVAMLEAQVERITREKNSLVNQLEESQHQLASHEMEMNRVCGEMRYQLNQTKMKKDEAEKELREYRTKTIRQLEIKDQKIEKLGLELNGNKQRLEQAQQDVAGAREDCLKLTELLSKSEHQLHLTRLEKESIQRSISNEAKARALQAQQREQELTQKMQQMEAQHEKTVNELDSLLTSQKTFIGKLKKECCLLASKLEQTSEKYRSKVNQLSQEKEYLHGRLEKMQKRNDELDQQCIQHGRMHERMKSRLHQLDKHCQATAQQLVELLNKQNQLFKEKQLLTEEVQFLRTQEKKWDADLKQDTDGIK